MRSRVRRSTLHAVARTSELFGKVLAVLRFVAPSVAGFVAGGVAGLVLGLVLVGHVLSEGGFPASAHAGPVVLVLLAFPPAIFALIGANLGFLSALFVEATVVLARRQGIGTPRRVAKLAMFVAGVAVAVWCVIAIHGEEDVVLLLARFVLAAGGIVPASFIAGGIAAAAADRLARGQRIS